MPIRVFIAEDTTAECTQASKLIEGITAAYLLTVLVLTLNHLDICVRPDSIVN